MYIQLMFIFEWKKSVVGRLVWYDDKHYTGEPLKVSWRISEHVFIEKWKWSRKKWKSWIPHQSGLQGQQP